LNPNQSTNLDQINKVTPLWKGLESCAFTLTELVVLLALLGFLACMMAPAFAKTRPNNATVQCLQNLRQLGMAWRMYAEDNSGRLPPNVDGGSINDAWVGGWLDYTASTANTNINYLINHDMYRGSGSGRDSGCGHLGPYVKDAAVFKCPTDTSVAPIGGQLLPRVRSYSMNGHVGEHTRNWSGNAFTLYSKITDIVNINPANLMLILDEREDSINDGAFLVDPDSPWLMVDYPGGFHNAGCNLVFADAHCETHKWQDPRTIPLPRYRVLLTLGVTLTGDVDVSWIQEHCAARR